MRDLIVGMRTQKLRDRLLAFACALLACGAAGAVAQTPSEPGDSTPSGGTEAKPKVETPAAEPLAEAAPTPSPDEAVGVTQFSEGRYRDAALAFERALAANGETAHLQTLVGVAHLLAGAPSRAVRAFGRAVALEPGVAAHHIRLGHAYRAAGALLAAERAYREALNRDPKNAEALRAVESLHRPGAPLHAGEIGMSVAREPEMRSYRGVLAITYLLAPVLGIALVAETQSPVGLVFVPAPSIVHAAYGNFTGAAVALLGMVGFTAIGAGIGYEVGCSGSGDELCGLALIPGAGIGYVAWALIDVAAFGEVEVEPASERAATAPTLHLTLAPNGGGLGAVLAGRL